MRVRCERERALALQEEAIAAWSGEIERRFVARDKSAPVTEILLRNG